jgi:predicted aminopeptidase
MIKKIFGSLLIIVALLLLWQHQLILYGISQAKGQFRVVLNSRKVSEVLQDPTVPDSVKSKLELIQEIKQFSYDALGYQQTDNYSTFFDQKGNPSLWVVTGSKPFALEPKEWYFPILGKVPYKGFFEYEKAEHEERKLEREEWDTNLRVAGGWSTLGWFSDPVLSNMLQDIPGELANTIIHELTHGNIFVKDSVEFNENLASFFGNQGAGLFLEAKYGTNSSESRAYQKSQSDRRKFTDHILRGADQLQELYQNQGETMALNLRYSPKRRLIDEIITSADTLTLYKKNRYIQYLKSSKVNNAFFLSYLRYRADYTYFEQELITKFSGDLKQYFQHFKETYPSL